MKINADELQAIENMLETYRGHHGDVTIKHDAMNASCSGYCSNSCSGSCTNGCGGGCQGSCWTWAR